MCSFSVLTYDFIILTLKLKFNMPKRYISPSCSNERKKQQTSACDSSEVQKSVVGNFHQASNIFPEWSRGRQYVSNSLISIL